MNLIGREVNVMPFTNEVESGSFKGIITEINDGPTGFLITGVYIHQHNRKNNVAIFNICLGRLLELNKDIQRELKIEEIGI